MNLLSLYHSLFHHCFVPLSNYYFCSCLLCLSLSLSLVIVKLSHSHAYHTRHHNSTQLSSDRDPPFFSIRTKSQIGQVRKMSFFFFTNILFYSSSFFFPLSPFFIFLSFPLSWTFILLYFFYFSLPTLRLQWLLRKQRIEKPKR